MPALHLGEVRAELSVTGSSIRIEHVATCPEVDPGSCATTEVPDHRHDQRIAWFRGEPSVAAGLGRGFELSLAIPFDLRATEIAYTTLEGAAYDPPYDDIHHRDEVVYGPADGAAMLRWRTRAGAWIAGVGAGASLPLGETVPDPFALGEAGEWHQHQQFGTGTVIPVLSGEAAFSSGRWGGLGWAQARLPLYANEHGYRAGTSAIAAAGPTFRVAPWLVAGVRAEGQVEGTEDWNGRREGGRASLAAGLDLGFHLGESLSLRASAAVPVLEHVEGAHGDGRFSQPFTATVAIGGVLARKGP